MAFGIGCAIGFYLILCQRGERLWNRAFFKQSVVLHNFDEVVATIGIHRISAVTVGFVGVLMIVSPGMDYFNLYSLIAVFGVLGMSMRDMGRVLRRSPFQQCCCLSIQASLSRLPGLACCAAQSGCCGQTVRHGSICSG